MPEAVLRASVRGAGRVATEFDTARRGMQNDIEDSLRRMGLHARGALSLAAPRDTGLLADKGVNVDFDFGNSARPQFTILVGVERDGFDYVPVTRFGHRQERIYPKLGRALRIFYDGRSKGNFALRRSARGVRVAFDWVEVVLDSLQADFDAESEVLGRKIETRFL